MLVFGAIFFLAFAGGQNQGGVPILGALFSETIADTSAYNGAGSSELLQADLNSISGFGTGYGGQSQYSGAIMSATVQNGSLLALAPTDSDYLDELAEARSPVVEYLVRDGDALSFIAADFGVSVASILWANDIDDPHSISINTVLRIPPVSGVVYSVEPGDTIDSIADEYGANIDEIIAFNSLPSNGALILGNEIIIPDGTVPAGEASSTPSGNARRTFAYLPNLGDYFGHPTNGVGYNWGRTHGRNAVDVADSCGTPIYAAADGVVTDADGEGWNGGFGRFVTIQHPNGSETLYAHARQLFVSVGEFVVRGDQIAEIGNSGQVYGVTGCHLHFEVHGAQNPLAKY